MNESPSHDSRRADVPSADVLSADVCPSDVVSKLVYTNLNEEHANELAALELLAFPNVDPSDLYNEDELKILARVFPEGNFAVLDRGNPIGMGLGVLLNFDTSQTQHDLADILGADGVGNHDLSNDWYYGTDIAVHPDYRGQGVGHELYHLRKAVVRKMGKRGIVAGGVIPGYADHRHNMTAAEYITRVAAGELYDSTLTFQLENGFEARGAIANYLADDSVGNYAAFIVWANPDLKQ